MPSPRKQMAKSNAIIKECLTKELVTNMRERLKQTDKKWCKSGTWCHPWIFRSERRKPEGRVVGEAHPKGYGALSRGQSE